MAHKMKFTDENEMKNSSKKIGMIKYNFNISEILQKSKLLAEKRTQKSLKDFFWTNKNIKKVKGIKKNSHIINNKKIKFRISSKVDLYFFFFFAFFLAAIFNTPPSFIEIIWQNSI